jgi:hypothetical protein
MYDDEIPHEMFNRLKRLVKKARALGSKKWIDHMLTERLMMTYTPMNYNIVALIRQDLDYKMMSSDNVLGWIIEGPEKATRGGGGEWEPIKIPHRNLAYVPKTTRRPSLLTRPRLNSYSKAVSRRNRARNCNESTARY